LNDRPKQLRNISSTERSIEFRNVVTMDTFSVQMRRLLAALMMITAGASFYGPLSAQSTIGGVINIYTPVLQITTDACAALLEVEDTTGFRAGDRVLLHQTMGCTGASDYTTDAVGLFEFATIERIRPNRVIELRRTLVHTYQRCNFVQLVRVPSYNGTTLVTTPLLGKPWDGKGGGIIALEVRGVLSLRSTIDASSIGYQGGAVRNVNNAQCSTTIGNTTIANPEAAMKGATFVYPRVDNVAGNAELFSAGGGGVGHNSGGGGGGNGGRGGNGGSQWQGCGAPFDNGGRGGISLPIQFNGLPYVRFGGGGGAGHMNNNTGTAGGSGGGIVIIKADTLYGNQNIIQSVGAAAQTAGNDGAGGGGAGGCVLISSSVLVGPLHITVNGGQGGNMSNGGLHGPGGGGGGGGVLYSGISLPAGVTFSAEGGVSGRCTAFTDAVQAAHLAKSGDPGSVAFRAVIPENTTPKPVLGVTILSDTTICPNQTVQLSLRTVGAVARIEWSELNGKTFATSSVVDVKPTRTASYVVTISDQTGCIALDTVTVTVLDGWKGLARTLDLGDVFCDKFIDTSLVVVNLGSAPGFVSKVVSTNPNAILSDSLPLRIGARDSVRIGMRIVTGNRSGNNTAVVSVTLSPCDSVVTATITWNRQNRLNTLTPRTVRMPEIYSCMGATRDTTIECRITGSNGLVRQIIGQGSVVSMTNVPFPIADGVPFQLALTWVPTAQQSQGRAGIVFEFEGCYDTLWVDVDGKVQMPRMSAPDTVELPDVVLCQRLPAVVSIPLTSIDSTTWLVDTVITPPGVTLDLVRGDSLQGVRVVNANVLPATLGRYTVTVAIRLIPCDTIITVVLVGNAIDARLTHSDTLIFTQPVIGRKQLLTARYVNTGDVTIDVLSVEPPAQTPFSYVTSRPSIPCSLLPGDLLECDVEITQRYGKHVDSLVLVTSNPCMAREKVVLVSEAYATTRLYMPDISSGIGRTELVPVLMDGRPSIDSVLLDSFHLEIAVRSADLAVTDGSSARGRWSTSTTDSLTQISIDGRWLGGDTVAVLPMKTLLSTSTTTPLMFVRQPGFQWNDQPCDVLYEDGSIVLGDICSGRTIRLVSIAQTRPVVISPNPGSDVVLIQPDLGVFAGVYEITLYDALGCMIFTVPGHRQSHIDVNGIASGMYMLCISDSSSMYSIPFIKN
jgi:hypothetical protein